MKTPPPETRYVKIKGDLYPAGRVGLNRRPPPITEEQATAIQAILLEEYESNPAFREAVNARAARLAAEKDNRGEAA